MVPVEICASRGEDRNAMSEHSRPKRRIGALQAGVWSPSAITTDRSVGARSIHLLTGHGKSMSGVEQRIRLSAMKTRHTAAFTLAVVLAIGLPLAAEWPA